MFSRLLPAGLVALALLAGCDTLPWWMVRQQRAQIGDYLHFDAQPLAHAGTPLPLPAAPATLSWPGGTDTATAESHIAQQGTVALLVLRRGELVYERYFNGFARETIGTSFSAAKSVVSALVGIAIAEGRITGVEQPVTALLPELLDNDPRFARITLRHLLQMRSGIAFDESYGSPFSEASHFYLSRNLPRQVAALRIAREPGQAYKYQSGDTQLLGMAVQRAVGMPLAAYAASRLWQPMGAEFDASWSVDSAESGVAKAFCCLNARAVDYARFGLLFLNQGRAGARQVVPADWVRQSTAPQLGLDGDTELARRNLEPRGAGVGAYYAWQWRRALARPVAVDTLPAPADDFYAEGLLGQYIYVAPVTQTVVVRLGRGRGAIVWPPWLGELARLNP